MLVGPVVPPAWRVQLLLGALLAGMLQRALVDARTVVAASAGAGLSMATGMLPAGLGILLGALGGVLVAGWWPGGAR